METAQGVLAPSDFDVALADRSQRMPQVRDKQREREHRMGGVVERDKGKPAASERRVALKPCVSRCMDELPSHLTADTVSCKQRPASRPVPHASVKVESSYFRANVSLRVS